MKGEQSKIIRDKLKRSLVDRVCILIVYKIGGGTLLNKYCEEYMSEKEAMLLNQQLEYIELDQDDSSERLSALSFSTINLTTKSF